MFHLRFQSVRHDGVQRRAQLVEEDAADGGGGCGRGRRRLGRRGRRGGGGRRGRGGPVLVVGQQSLNRRVQVDEEACEGIRVKTFIKNISPYFRLTKVELLFKYRTLVVSEAPPDGFHPPHSPLGSTQREEAGNQD